LNVLPIESVAEKLGMNVRSHRALCFMHDDRNPSLTFSASKNLFRCWVCGIGGGPIRLVQEHENLSFQEACVWLGKQFGVWSPSDYIPIRRAKIINKPAKKQNAKTITHKEVDTEVGEWILAHAGLSEEAKHFLFEQRMYSPEAVTQLKIVSLGDNIADLLRNLEHTFGRERCQKSGFLWSNGSFAFCYDAPCLLFPFYTTEGLLYSIQSRYLGDNPKITRFRFPKDVRQGIFNAPILKTVASNERLYVSEGITDCMALLSSGKKAVAFPGAGIYHTEDVLLLTNKSLYMYPDNDEAGTRLYNKLNEILQPYANSVRRLSLMPGCKDYSEMHIKEKLGY